jgi:2-phospho-L-lactate guanylyltransferase
MRVLVPFDATEPKSRLSSVLDAEERRDFADAMLADVLGAVEAAGHEADVLATEPLDLDVPVTVDDRPLTAAVNDVIADAGPPLAVLVADLPLATGAAVSRLLDRTDPLALAPGRGGGTNGLLVRDGAFRVDFHGASIRDHRQAARAAGLEPAMVDSFRLAVDVDEPADLAEVLIHGEGRAADWLRDAGVELSVTEGRVGVTRPGGGT